MITFIKGTKKKSIPSTAIATSLVSALCALFMMTNSVASSGCYQWSLAWAQARSAWFSTPEEALPTVLQYCNSSPDAFYDCTRAGPCMNGWMQCGPITAVVEPLPTVWPNYNARLSFTCVTTQALYDFNKTPVGTKCDTSYVGSFYFQSNPAGCFYTTTVTPVSAESGSCKQGQSPMQSCGDPVNPANGNVFSLATDISENSGVDMHFQRYFNSAGAISSGTMWKGTFGRHIVANQSIASYQPLNSNTNAVSSRYQSEAAACTSGFLEIQSQAPNWSDAVAGFSGGVCSLTRAGVNVGTLTIYTTSASGFEATPPGYDYFYDDGKVVHFSVLNNVIAAPPGTSLQLVKTASGFTVTDGADKTEQYDSTGKLLSVTARSGVLQAMSYDSVGRLSVVTDNFGHQLTLSYDVQNRLISVTRQ